MPRCPYCGETFKRITTNHLRKHGVTWDEYLKDFRKEDYIDKIIIDFINDFYIGYRSKYLIYNYKCKNPITCKCNNETTPMLHKGHISMHRSHRQTLGIFFSQLGSNLIGLDIDKLDKDLLSKVYSKVVEFIPETCVLASFSGGKGYHVDIFLEKYVSRDIIKKFHEVIIRECGTTSDIVELRGANDQGYKLPFGIHQGTQKYCYCCTKDGEEIKDNNLEEILNSKQKASVKHLQDVIEKHWKIDGELNNNQGPLTERDIEAFNEIKDSVKPLKNYGNLQENFEDDLYKIYLEGFNGSGMRNKYTLKIALFLKCKMNLGKVETLNEMLAWSNRCKGYESSKKEFEDDIKRTVENVFAKDLKLTIAAKEIRISKLEIKEVVTLKTKNKLQTKALRQLYYMFLLQSKAYADKDGIFYFTLEQMQQMGATNNKKRLLEQINNLIELGKLYKYQTKRVTRTKNAPAKYRLTILGDVTINLKERTFKLCNEMGKCDNCIDCATCYLIRNTKERKESFTGRIVKCPHNKD